MKRPGWDARRRNRNIGTAKSGHGADNCFDIPSRGSSDHAYFETLKDPVVFERPIGQRNLTFLVERPSSPYFYPCTVDDVVRLLAIVPHELIRPLDYFIFRHPSKKERVLRPVWGRFVDSANFGNRAGTAIYIESQDPGARLRWPKSLSPRDLEELARLRKDGHRVVEGSRYYEIRSTPDALRITLLFRTILHELGHLNDWASGNHRDGSSTAEREAFANRFAALMWSQLAAQQQVPFDQILEKATIERDGLKFEYFYPPG